MANQIHYSVGAVYGSREKEETERERERETETERELELENFVLHGP